MCSTNTLKAWDLAADDEGSLAGLSELVLGLFTCLEPPPADDARVRECREPVLVPDLSLSLLLPCWLALAPISRVCTLPGGCNLQNKKRKHDELLERWAMLDCI